MGDNGYLRVRFGVGRPPAGWETADYVLGHWTNEEQAALGAAVDKAADAVETLVEKGLQAAMNQFHFRETPNKEPNSLKAQSVQALVAAGV